MKSKNATISGKIFHKVIIKCMDYSTGEKFEKHQGRSLLAMICDMFSMAYMLNCIKNSELLAIEEGRYNDFKCSFNENDDASFLIYDKKMLHLKEVYKWVACSGPESDNYSGAYLYKYTNNSKYFMFIPFDILVTLISRNGTKTGASVGDFLLKHQWQKT